MYEVIEFEKKKKTRNRIKKWRYEEELGQNEEKDMIKKNKKWRKRLEEE